MDGTSVRPQGVFHRHRERQDRRSLEVTTAVKFNASAQRSGEQLQQFYADLAGDPR